MVDFLLGVIRTMRQRTLSVREDIRQKRLEFCENRKVTLTLTALANGSC